MLEYKLLYEFQSGCVSGHQLIELYHKICIALENGPITVAVFYDISKAFDRLWHKGLIEKLKSWHKRKIITMAQRLYLRKEQQVLLNNSISTLGTLKAGVRRCQL